MFKLVSQEEDRSIFNTKASAIVNPVNCKGIAGAGLALAFKWKYPKEVAEYIRACKAGELSVGKVLVCPTGQRDGVRWVIHLPTKDDWRAPSRLEYVVSGCQALAEAMMEHDIPSVALPALGCGCGALKWADVEPAIRSALADAAAAGRVVLLYEPKP